MCVTVGLGAPPAPAGPRPTPASGPVTRPPAPALLISPAQAPPPWVLQPRIESGCRGASRATERRVNAKERPWA